MSEPYDSMERERRATQARIAALERRLELSEARRLETVERSARVQYCQTCHGGMGFVAPESETCPWCRLAESEAERARHKAALAGALHVSGASEDTLVEFVARLYARAAESEASAAAMREALECVARKGCYDVINYDGDGVQQCEWCGPIERALSSTAGADLLREVTALRELEKAIVAVHSMPHADSGLVEDIVRLGRVTPDTLVEERKWFAEWDRREAMVRVALASVSESRLPR